MLRCTCEKPSNDDSLVSIVHFITVDFFMEALRLWFHIWHYRFIVNSTYGSLMNISLYARLVWTEFQEALNSIMILLCYVLWYVFRGLDMMICNHGSFWYYGLIHMEALRLWFYNWHYTFMVQWCYVLCSILYFTYGFGFVIGHYFLG